jgi:cation:H+ antiporter
MSLSLLALAIGLVCAGIGGELFLRAVSAYARAWRLSAAFAGASIAACATSSPELSVAVGSALAGTPEIALGDCIGSNVVNVALILGGALILGPLHYNRESVQRDLRMALFTPLLTAGLALDGTISRPDGVLMIACFFVWLAIGMHDARRLLPAAHSGPASPTRRMVLAGIAGLLLLVTASKLIVSAVAAAILHAIKSCRRTATIFEKERVGETPRAGSS